MREPALPARNCPTGLVVERADILSPEARALIEALNAELSSRYPEDGATHFRLDEEEVAPGRGAFLIAARAGKPIGCGAVRRIEAGTAEIKRMYVIPEAAVSVSAVPSSRRSSGRRARSTVAAWCWRPVSASRRRSPCTSTPGSRVFPPSANTCIRR